MRGMLERLLYPFILIIGVVLLVIVYVVGYVPYWIVTGKNLIFILKPIILALGEYHKKIFWEG